MKNKFIEILKSNSGHWIVDEKLKTAFSIQLILIIIIGFICIVNSCSSSNSSENSGSSVNNSRDYCKCVQTETKFGPGKKCRCAKSGKYCTTDSTCN